MNLNPSKALLVTAIFGTLVTFALHFTWEMLQAPAFTNFAASTWEGIERCLSASLGDVAIAAGAYIVTASGFQRPAWPVHPGGWMLPAATWIGLGVIATVSFEWWALARGRWSYAPAMPVVMGIGLLPLLQWLIVPALTLLIVRQLAWRKHVS